MRSARLPLLVPSCVQQLGDSCDLCCCCSYGNRCVRVNSRGCCSTSPQCALTCAGCDLCSRTCSPPARELHQLNPSDAGGAMGCSSSTLTHTQGSNRPKSVEANGPKKSASSEVSDQIIDDIETIPDQTKLDPMTENEPSTNGIPPGDEQTGAVTAVELDEEETTEPAAEDGRTSSHPTEEGPAHIEDLITGQDSSVVEGEIEEAMEAKIHEEVVSEGPETKEDETRHSADEAEPEMGSADVEE